MNKELNKNYKWVNIITNKPPLEKFIHVTDNTGTKRMGNFYEGEKGVCFSVCGTEMYEPYIVQNEHIGHIYWLEECNYTINPSTNMTQTAVQWLQERFEKLVDCQEGHYKATEYTLNQLSNDFEQALKLEREQIEEAFVAGDERGTNDIPFNAEQYYDQNFNQEK